MGPISESDMVSYEKWGQNRSYWCHDCHPLTRILYISSRLIPWIHISVKHGQMSVWNSVGRMKSWLYRPPFWMKYGSQILTFTMAKGPTCTLRPLRISCSEFVPMESFYTQWGLYWPFQPCPAQVSVILWQSLHLRMLAPSLTEPSGITFIVMRNLQLFMSVPDSYTPSAETHPELHPTPRDKLISRRSYPSTHRPCNIAKASVSSSLHQPDGAPIIWCYHCLPLIQRKLWSMGTNASSDYLIIVGTIIIGGFQRQPKKQWHLQMAPCSCLFTMNGVPLVKFSQQ